MQLPLQIFVYNAIYSFYLVVLQSKEGNVPTQHEQIKVARIMIFEDTMASISKELCSNSIVNKEVFNTQQDFKNLLINFMIQETNGSSPQP